jgi:hypothetical protein
MSFKTPLKRRAITGAKFSLMFGLLTSKHIAMIFPAASKVSPITKLTLKLDLSIGNGKGKCFCLRNNAAFNLSLRLKTGFKFGLFINLY